MPDRLPAPRRPVVDWAKRARASLVALVVVASVLLGVPRTDDAGAGPTDLLLVTADGAATGRNADLSALFVTFGWTVTTIDDDADPAALTAAAESSAVVWIAGGTNSAAADELSVVRVPVVSEDTTGWGVLMQPGGGTLSSTGTGATYTTLDVVEAIHPITSPLGVGSSTVFTSGQPWVSWTSSIGAGMQTLATRPDSASQLVLFVAESGAEMISGEAENRRVFLGLEQSSLSAWNAALEGVVERSLDWAAAGTASSAPPGSPIGDLVMVTGNGGFGGGTDGAKRNLFESFGWTVTALDDDATPTEVTAAATANDVMFMSDSVNGSEAYDVRDEAIGIVNENFSGWSGFLNAAAQDQSFTSGTAINVVNASHPITAASSLGPLTIHTASDDINYWDSGVTALPSGVDVLAEAPASSDFDALLVAEAGAALYSSYTAVDRRVWFPSDLSDPAVWTNDYETLLQRSLLWAASFSAETRTDSDSDGLWDSEEDANTDADNDPATNPGPNTDSDGLANYLDADDDGDGTPTASENPDPNGDGDPRDARDADRDGEPNYLDAPTGPSDGAIATVQKVSDTEGSFDGVLSNGDAFGRQTVPIGDLDGDGVVDLMAGVPGADDGGSNRGAAFVMFMNADGTVRSEQKISDTEGNFTATLADGDSLGESVGPIGDLNGDGRIEVALAANRDGDGGANSGAVYVLFLEADGTVASHIKLSSLTPGVTLPPGTYFGETVIGPGDVNGDGVPDLAVGALYDDDGGLHRGAVHMLFLDETGSVVGQQKISDTAGDLVTSLDNNDEFGSAAGSLGDLNGDGTPDIIVGARGDDDGATGTGAAYILFLDPDGTVNAEYKISATSGDLTGEPGAGSWFGRSAAGVGDIDGDGNVDALVGAPFDATGGSNTGAAHLLFLRADGTVRDHLRYDATTSGLTGRLDAGDEFGTGVGSIGDLDGDGTLGLVMTARYDDDGGSARGAVYVVDLQVAATPGVVRVNSTGDGADAAAGDGVCSTGGTNSEGAQECTLRAAIEESNASISIGTIEFAIPNSDPNHRYYQDDSTADSLGTPVVTTLDDASVTDFDPDYPVAPFSWWSIEPATDLPYVTAATLIDGTTQPGWSANTAIDGSPVDMVLPIRVVNPGFETLAFTGGGATVRGMQLSSTNGSATMLGLYGTGGHTAEGLWLMTDPTGAATAPGDFGIYETAGSNQIGGPDPSDLVLVGDGFGGTGVDLTGDGNTVQNLWIGVSVLGNETLGDYNDITLDVDGNDNVIGTAGAGVIAATSLNGQLYLTGDRNTVQGSRFGILADGTLAPDIRRDQVVIRGVDNMFGGVNPGEGNIVVDGTNPWDTLDITAGSGHSVLGSLLLDLDGGQLYLDISPPAGPNTNDVGDLDSGVNGLLNHPVITSITDLGSNLDVDFELDVPAGDYRIEFFGNDETGAPGTGHGAGDFFIGAAAITHAGAGAQTFSTTLSDAGDHYLAATATEDLGSGDYGSTSEFGRTVCVGDSDGDGLCDDEEDANTDSDGDPSTNPGPNTDGDANANYLDADDDGDGMPTASENADPNGDGDPRDAVDSDFDGQPDYLDPDVVGPSSTPITSEQKVSDSLGGLAATLDDADFFGFAAASIGDIDSDGVGDIAVTATADDDGGSNRGAVYVLFLNADGSVKAEQKISSTAGGLAGPLANNDYLGAAVAGLGDVNGDGIGDLAVGAGDANAGGTDRGAVYVLFLNADGTVKGEQEISSTDGGFAGPLVDFDYFGYGLAGPGDIDGDGVNDLVVGSPLDDGGGTDRGAVYVLFLNGDGTVRAEQEISDSAGGLTATLQNTDLFGQSVAALGDLDGDGVTDLVVGAERDDDGGSDQGAVYVLFLNADGSVKAEQKISAATGGFTGPLDTVEFFGARVAGLGDIDGDGLPDVAVSAHYDDDGGANRGAVYLLTLNADGTVKDEQKISSSAGGLTGPLDDQDNFGRGLAGLGDLDADGQLELLIGAPSDGDGGANRGAVYVLDLSVDGCAIDSDSDGLGDCWEDADTDADNDPSTNPGPNTDGDANANYLDADDDGDGMPTASENADPNGDGDPRDAVDSDFDGQPDYLDEPSAPSVLPIADETKISSTSGDVTGPLANFGMATTSIGDLDGDGIVDLAAGSSVGTGGSVFVLFMNGDGTVRAEQQIGDGVGAFSVALDSGDRFGDSVAGLGDLDGDGVNDLVVGAQEDDDGNTDAGAVYVLFMNRDGTVKSEQKISATSGGLAATLDVDNSFGSDVAGLGDFDGDGIPDIAVGALGDDDGGSLYSGAFFVLLLNADGSVKSEQKISPTTGGLTGPIGSGDYFGKAVTSLGDLDGDGTTDLAVGEYSDGVGVGALWVLFMNPDGTVKDEQKIGNGTGGLGATLGNNDFFGFSIANMGDVGGDGVVDLAVGTIGDDDGGPARGAVYLLALNVDGTVRSTEKISATSGGFSGPLDDVDQFGSSVASLGDLDGDGAVGLAIGARYDDDGGASRGAVYVVDLMTIQDSDGDGLWDAEEDANTDFDGDPATNPGPNTDGDVNPNYLDADDDDDGTPTASENADPNGDGDPRDALDSDFDGEPDYLDPTSPVAHPLVVADLRIGPGQGGLTATLDGGDTFGRSLASIGDLDRDGVVDMAVGAPFDDDGGSNRGAVHILFLNADGTVKAEQKISDTVGGLSAALDNSDFFGWAVGAIGDIDGDGLVDVAVGSNGDDDGGSRRGAVYVLFLNADGTVKGEHKISDTVGGFTATLADFDRLGDSVAGLGDLDGDGVGDMAVGASGGDAAYVLLLDSDGTLKAETRIATGSGGLSAAVSGDIFGSSVSGLGDLDGDGIEDLLIGAPGDDDGASSAGAAYVLFLHADGTVRTEQKISSTDGGLELDLLSFSNFGTTSAPLGDLYGRGTAVVAFGLPTDDGGGLTRGSVYLVELSGAGGVLSHVEISNAVPGLSAVADFAEFGYGLGALGDLDGNGTVEFAVGAADDGTFGVRGQVVIVDLCSQIDTDGDGLWDCEEDANTDFDGDPATNPGPNTDGDANPNYLDADDDDDGTPTVSENADPDGDGDPRDALDSDNDGEPDYLDLPAGSSGPVVAAVQKISQTAGGFTGPLADGDGFGSSVTAIGDLDGDGVVDVVVAADQDDTGGTSNGAVWVLLLNADGTVKAEQKIASGTGGLTHSFAGNERFGFGIAEIGDLDGDGRNELAVGAVGDLGDGGTSFTGAVHVLFLNANGTVRNEVRIASGAGGFVATIDDDDNFGSGVAGVGDVDGDGIPDMAVGANGDDDGGSARGAVYVLFMNADGSVRAEQKISQTSGGLSATIGDSDFFGVEVEGIGDVDGNGVPDLAVGATGDDEGAVSAGAVYVLLLDTDGTVVGDHVINASSGDLRNAPDDSFELMGGGLAGVGDLDGDGVPEIAVGAGEDEFGGIDHGSVRLLFLRPDGSVKREATIGEASAVLGAVLPVDTSFGSGVAAIGDLDGDGTVGLLVGADGDDDGGSNRGAVYVLDLSADPCGLDTDSDGLWDCEEDDDTDFDGDPATNPGPNTDGDANPNYLDTDDDGDGTPTVSEDADPNGDGDPRDALDTDRDGQSDYLEAPTTPVFGLVAEERKISSTSGGLVGPLDNSDTFGSGVTPIGDVDGDGVVDVVVGAATDDDGGTDRGAVYVLFLNADGSVRAEQKISATAGGLVGPLDDSDYFGEWVGNAGDLDGDGRSELIVGARLDEDGGPARGAAYVLFLNADGSVRAEQKISDTAGGLVASLDDFDGFGVSVDGVGDLDGDGVPDVVVGADDDDDGGSSRGAVYVLFLNADGSVRAEQKISDTAGGLVASLDDVDYFGEAVAGIGDVDGDGTPDLAVGAWAANDGSADAGAVYVLFMNTDGTVRAEQKISATAGGLTATLESSDWFGGAVGAVGDLDGDGTPDLLVGAPGDDDGGLNRGAVYVLLLNGDGTVKSTDKISDLNGGLATTLGDGDWFGIAVRGLGDLDNDGTIDFAGGAMWDDDGGSNRGAVYLLDLCGDSDGDGLCNAVESLQGNTDGDAFPNENDPDDDGDGIPTASENADPNGDGDPRDALDDDLDGEADYLDSGVGRGVGFISEITKISDTTGGLAAALANGDNFGYSSTSIGDLDGDGVVDIAVGAAGDDSGGSSRGAVYVLFLNADGTVRDEQKISELNGGGPNLANNDGFGIAISSLGDLDGDGRQEVAVGTLGRDAVFVLFLNADGTVRAEQEIASGVGGFSDPLTNVGRFGFSVAGVGDLDGDGINDMVVGDDRSDQGGFDYGAIYVLFLNSDGTVKAEQEISAVAGGLSHSFSGSDEEFGGSVAGLGDVDGDGIEDLAVGSVRYLDGSSAQIGGVHILLLNADGTVKDDHLISSADGTFPIVMEDSEWFGGAVAGIGDIDADGVGDLLIGAPSAYQDAASGGAFFVVNLNSDGTVAAASRVGGTSGPFRGEIESNDYLGGALSGLGDIDGDGRLDIVVGATTDDDGGSSRGAVYVAELCLDSDDDGLCDRLEALQGNTDGDAFPNENDPDDDGDVSPTAGEDADPNLDGDPRDARDTDRDGQPDYLDVEAGSSTTPVADEQKISSTAGGLTGPIDSFDVFGASVSGLGDLDGDGVNDVVVGAPQDSDGGVRRGAVYVLFLNADGTVRAEQKISDAAGGLAAVLDDADLFGSTVAGLGDVDGDGIADLAVSAVRDDDGGSSRGAVYVLFLNADGTVRAEQKISDTAGGLAAVLDDGDEFGSALAGIGDVDGDGIGDLAVGVRFDDDGGSNRGAVYVLFLNADGTVRAEQKISDTAGGLAAVLDDSDQFGSAVAGTGDVDGDGAVDLAVGASRDDDGALNTGAVYVLFLNTDGTVRAEQKVSATAGGLSGPLGANGFFGEGLAGIGDLSGDGVPDIAVGTPDDADGAGGGAVFLLSLDASGAVVDEAKISGTEGGLTGPLDNNDEFGISVASLGDLDRDGAVNLGVGAYLDDDGAVNTGAIYVLDLSPPPLVVNSTGDIGDLVPGDGACNTGALNSQGAAECTLRAAIEEANANGSSGINFAVPTSEGGYDAAGFWRVAPTTALPRLTVPVTIDGTTQPGYVGDPLIEIADGANVSTGVELDGAASLVRGLSITGFQTGVRVGSTGTTVQGSWIGTRPDGTEFGNSYGVIVDGGAGAIIGGSGPGEGNVVARAFTSGIRLASGSSVVQGNSIGRRPDGVVTVMDVGIEVDSSGNLIGGTAPGEGNEITGSTETAASRSIRADAGIGNTIIGNTMSGNIQNLDLGADGLTPNDPLDGDAGPNDLLNTPELAVTAIAPLGGGTSSVDLDVTLDVPAGDYRIEVFDGAAPGYGGEGNAEQLVHTFSLTHPGGGAQVFSTTYSGPDPGFLSATATEDLGASDFGSTSELSTVAGVFTGTLVVNSTADAGDSSVGDGVCDTGATNSEGATECTLRAAIEEANRGQGVTIDFALPTTEPGYVVADAFWRIDVSTLERLLSRGLTIDGSSQAGYDGSRPVVFVADDSSGIDLVTFGAADQTIRALALGFPGDDAVQLEGDRALIDSVWIGLDPAGGYAGSTSFSREGIIVYDGSVDGVVTNSRIANFDSGIVSNGGTIGLTVTNTEVFANGNGGVVFDDLGRITLLGNSIHDNVGLGLELGNNDGTPMPNDVGDGDTGGNDLLNKPVLTSITLGVGTVDVDYTIDVPAGTYRIEFFDSDRPDPTGFGEGQTFLSAESIVHPGGSASYTATVTANAGDVLTATATPDLGGGSFGGTSEFSNAALIGIVFVNSTGDGGDLTTVDGLCDTGGLTADGGAECTLRAAIEQANAATDIDRIHFQLPDSDAGLITGGAFDRWLIAPTSALPTMNDVSVLDASTQPLWSGTPLVQLDGLLAGPGVDGLAALDQVEVAGLSVTGWQGRGATIGGSTVTLRSNWFGLTPAGAVAANAGSDVLSYGSASDIAIGGADDLDGNVFAAAGSGVGLSITGSTSTVVVDQNHFGVAADAVTPLSSAAAELLFVVDDASSITIRNNQFGAAPNAAVVVSGAADQVDITGNLFGTDATRSASFPVGQALYANSSGDVRFGGTAPGDGNTVLAQFDAIVVTPASTGDVSILGNSIAGSGAIGIDLDDDGPTANDALDGDTGANDLLNFPEIVTAEAQFGVVVVTFDLDVPAGDYRIEAFANPGGADPSGFGEGEEFAGAVDITHPGGGSQRFGMSISAEPGDAITMTTTEDVGAGAYGATSEFSLAVVSATPATVEDLSLRRTDLALVGGADGTPSAGVAGDSLSLDGSFERLVGPPTDITSGALTLSAWVRLDSVAGDPRLISKGVGAGVVYEVFVDSGTSEAVARFAIGGAIREVSGGTVSVGTWQQVTATWDGSTMRLFVDGFEVDSLGVSGALATDLDAPLVIGNTESGTAGLDGSIDQVEIEHQARPARVVAARFRNGESPTAFVSLGGAQAEAPAPWTTSATQPRTGSNSLQAPQTSPGSDAWLTAIGIDEPGVEVTAWWWVSAPSLSEVAIGTRTGSSATDQFDVASSGAGLELSEIAGATQTSAGTDPTQLTAGSWQQVVMSTDELGVTSFRLDGATLLGPNALVGQASGSIGFRAADLDPGAQWFIDDVVIRRLVSDEPTTSLGPLERN